MELTKGKKQRKADPMLLQVLGKVPPQAREFEAAVLGAIMLEKGAFDRAAETIRPECFYVDSHQKIFQAMQQLSSKSQPIDVLTVQEQLKRNGDLDGIGGMYALTELTRTVVSAANIESYCRVIVQKFVQRELIRIGSEIVSAAYEESSDAFELLDYAGECLSTVGESLSIGDMISIDTVLIEAIQKIEEWRHMETSVTGVPSGFPQLDQATRGWQDGDLIILAARPSVGKTALALNIVRNAAEHFLRKETGQTVAVWSLEMKAIMLVLRMLAAQSKELLYKIQTGRLDESAMMNIYNNGIRVLSRLGILFDDKSGLTILKLRAKARKLKRKNKLGLIVLDYLQLMKSDSRKGNREQEISDISRSLKELAQELQVPIIALSQLNRDVEKRTGSARKPQVSDIRESGAIEQDADVIMLLWGPTDDEVAEDASLLNRRYLKIAKQRNGVLLTVELNFKDEIQFFSQMEQFSTGSWRPLKDFTAPKPNLFIAPPEADEDPF